MRVTALAGRKRPGNNKMEFGSDIEMQRVSRKAQEFFEKVSSDEEMRDVKRPGAKQSTMSRSEQPLSAPEKLRADHDLSQFDSGEPSLDDWLRRRALPNEESGASRTYVVCAGQHVVGYYALAVGAVTHAEAPGRVRRNMPDPVPVHDCRAVGRSPKLSRDERSGRALLRDAVLRTSAGRGDRGYPRDSGARDFRAGARSFTKIAASLLLQWTRLTPDDYSG